MQTEIFSATVQVFRALSLVLLFSLAGCGGGGGGSAAVAVATSPAAEDGTLILTVTDAEGDFVSYTVDVTSIRLQGVGGKVVETLPLASRVDFAELTEITEFLTIATVPAGRYESVSLTLDYSNAEILVQDSQGNSVAALAYDEAGARLGEVNVQLNLTSGDYLVIRPGIPATFSLDFDLDASNSIDLNQDPAVVTVAPFLLATPEFETDREHRIRGLLARVDTAEMEISLKVRPFWHHQGDFGRFVLQVADETVFEVDGAPLDANEGLAAVAALPVDSPLVAHGMIRQGEFVADTIVAGTSVAWSDADVVKGIVTARNGDTLQLRGARVYHTDGVRWVRDQVEVLISSNTAVTALGMAADSLSSQSVSVGQSVVAFGELSDDGGDVVLDATSGRVRMQISDFGGEVVTADPLVVDLQLLNGRRPARYDFSGTGLDPADDADPDHYQVFTAPLPLTSLEAGEMVRVRGLVNEFGAAPDDFLARSVIDPATSTRPATFVALWPEPAADALTSVSDLSVTLDLTEARSLLNILCWRGDADTSLEAVTLQAPASGHGVYAIRVRGEGAIHLYRNFADLSAQLLLQLDAGNALKRVAAHGRYNGPESLEMVRGSFEFLRTQEE